jgi:exopolysaccharide biosynthesis WecB/TagA/CpsF family protein
VFRASSGQTACDRGVIASSRDSTRTRAVGALRIADARGQRAQQGFTTIRAIDCVGLGLIALLILGASVSRISGGVAMDIRFSQPHLRRLAGLDVWAATYDEVASAIADALLQRDHAKIAFCNAHVINVAFRDPHFRQALAACTVLPDGVGVDLGSRLIYGEPFPANLNGTDFVPRFLAGHRGALKVRLIGARPGVAERAAQALREMTPRHDIAVVSDGYFDDAGERDILSSLAADPADILLVAMGNPRQEIWMTEMISASHARIVFGVGALFDFLAGEVPRAPMIWRRLRLEWAFRLLVEPGRLWRRYLVGNPEFLLRIFRIWWHGGERLR